jgi:hypothetical protein
MQQIFYLAAVAIISIVVTRWVLSVDHFINTAKAQIGLLILLAKKNGATKEEIDEVLDKSFGTEGKKKITGQ